MNRWPCSTCVVAGWRPGAVSDRPMSSAALDDREQRPNADATHGVMSAILQDSHEPSPVCNCLMASASVPGMELLHRFRLAHRRRPLLPTGSAKDGSGRQSSAGLSGSLMRPCAQRPACLAADGKWAGESCCHGDGTGSIDTIRTKLSAWTSAPRIACLYAGPDDLPCRESARALCQRPSLSSLLRGNEEAGRARDSSSVLCLPLVGASAMHSVYWYRTGHGLPPHVFQTG